MINPATLIKLKGAWGKFSKNHPKFMPFMRAASNGMINEDSIVEVSVTSADGKKISTNIKVTKEDLELFEQVKNLT